MQKNEMIQIIQENIEKQNIEEAKSGIMQYKKVFKENDELASMEAIVNI